MNVLVLQDLHLTFEFQDVVRTLPGDPVFREERTRKMMKTMLFIYAKRVPQMGYKQGMHELLATAIKVQMGK